MKSIFWMQISMESRLKNSSSDLNETETKILMKLLIPSLTRKLGITKHYTNSTNTTKWALSKEKNSISMTKINNNSELKVCNSRLRLSESLRKILMRHSILSTFF